MTTMIRRIAGVTVLAATLAACGGSDSTSAPPPVVVTPPPAPLLEDGFGAGFGSRYRTGMNTDATDPVAGDLGAVSLTAEATTI